MYLKDKDNKVFVRISNEQLEYLDKMAKDWNMSRSQFIRVIIDSYMAKGGRDNGNN